jgi:ABC-type antimicrobial peptide transport system permease subunit
VSDDLARGLIVVLLIGSFIALMATVLMGMIKIENPEIAKLIGAVFGYVTGMLSAVFAHYFRKNGV